MHNAISQLVFDLGVRFRNRRILDKHAFLLRSDQWSRETLLEHQNKSLVTLIKRASQYSAFYRQRFEEHGIDISKVKCIADLADLPVTCKLDLVSNRHTNQSTVAGQKNVDSFTSGSSGLALNFERNQDWDAWHNAAVMRGYGWHNVRFSDRKGYLWGYNLDPSEYRKARVLDMIQNRFRMFSYDEEDMAAFCRKLSNATCLDGYSSMIYEVANYLEKHPDLKNTIDLKLVKGTAEKILDVYQDKALSAFGQRIRSEYGSAEAGIIAFECPAGKMHVTMETVILECVEGRAIVTNLVSDSFPVIRYDIGDAIDMDFDEKCSCGRHGYIVREVTGRIGKVIQGHQGRYPSLTLYSLFKSLRKNYGLDFVFQGVQKNAGEITIRLDREISDTETSLLLKEAAGYFKNDLDITVESKVQLVTGKSKMMDFVSELK